MNKLTAIITDDAKRICDSVELRELADKTILITGASGLAGVYFVATLRFLHDALQLPFKVFALIQNKPPAYLSSLLSFEGVQVLQGDLTDYQFCSKLPNADYIIHAAGYAQPARFMQNPLKTLKLNTLATFLLFERLSPNGKFLFISSSEVYSGLSGPSHNESEIGRTNPLHARACYIEAKRCGETICNANRSQGVNAKSARLSLAYGPGTKKGDLRVLNSFIEKALKGKIELLDHGKANRTYCYISDAVELMWNILLFGAEPVYNVGGISRISIGELALKIGAYMNVPVIFPTNQHETAGAPPDVSLDISKVKREFGKTEYVPFEIGLARTIEWQKNLYQSE